MALDHHRPEAPEGLAQAGGAPHDRSGAADDYWSRWLAAVALRPDLPRLTKQSLKVERGSAKKPVQRRTSTKARKSSSR